MSRLLPLRMLGMALIAIAPPALAEIEGIYLVEGNRPGSALAYTGRVTVALVGEKYTVTWEIDGAQRVGVGLGGAFSEGSFMVGPAHPDDLMITIGFSDGATTGAATMFLQDTGNYEGFYVESGSDFAGFEVWSPEETQ